MKSRSFQAQLDLDKNVQRRMAEVVRRLRAVAATPGHPRQATAQYLEHDGGSGYPLMLKVLARKSKWRRAVIKYLKADAKIPWAVKRRRAIQSFNRAMGYGAMGPEFGL